MVGNLLAQHTKFRAFQLESLAQQWVERLAKTIPVASQSRNGKRCDMFHAVHRIRLLRCQPQEVTVLHVLDHALQETQWLIKVNRHCDLAQLLPDATLQNRHHVEILLLEHGNRQNFPVNELMRCH